jgi:hypothetical protein
LDLVRQQPESPLAPLDRVAKKLEPLSNVHHPRLLRMQIYAQLLQYLTRRNYCRARLCRGLTGDNPVIRVSRYLIPLAAHFPIKRRQEYVT